MMNFNKLFILNFKARSNVSRNLSHSIILRNITKAENQTLVRNGIWNKHNINVRCLEKFQTSLQTRNSYGASNEHAASTDKFAPIDYHPVQFEDVPFDESVPYEQVIEALKRCSSIEDQMKAISTTLGLCNEDVQRRLKFSKTIESMLSPFFPDINIQIFGSTVNGFGFKGCDIDMSFSLTSEVPGDHMSSLTKADIPLVHEVLCGKVPVSHLYLLSKREKLLFIHTVFLEFYKESAYGPMFINAHVPIVRFQHDKYKLKCDLSFKNSVALTNTKLLYLYGKLDDRVRPMMMTIRYWAKHVELIGKGLMFNTYTVALLVIFFLQNRNPPILPSADYILSLTDDLNSEDMSDQSFLNVIKSIPPTKNKEPLDLLLKEFFLYYLYFDFTRVICPSSAKSIPRDEFFSNESNPKFRMNTICVQDPILPSHNVAELVEYKRCKNLFFEFMIASKMFQNPEDFLYPQEKNWGLLSLLDKPEDMSPKNVSYPKMVTFKVPLVSELLRPKEIPSENRELFITAHTVLDILEYVLLMECQITQYGEAYELLKKYDVASAKHKNIIESVKDRFYLNEKFLTPNFEDRTRGYKKEKNLAPNTTDFSKDFKNFNAHNNLILCVICGALQNTWHGRCHVASEDTSIPAKNILEIERSISLRKDQNGHVIEQVYHKSEDRNSKPLKFLCECYSVKDDATSLLVNFRPLEKYSFNPVLGIFLQEFIPKMLSNIESSKR